MIVLRGSGSGTGTGTGSGSGLRLRAWGRALCVGDRVLGAAMLALIVWYVAQPGVFEGKHSGDGRYALQYLRGALHEGSLDLGDALPAEARFFGRDPHTGRVPNRNPIGPALAWLPFYAAASLLARAGHALGLVPALPPDSAWHAFAAGTGTLALVLLGQRQLYRLIERHAGRGAARMGAVAAVWATPIAWYAAVQPLYQHGAAFALVAIFVERWDATRGRTDARRFAWLGLLGGVGACMRLQEVLFLLLPGAEVARLLLRPTTRAPHPGGGSATLGADVRPDGRPDVGPRPDVRPRPDFRPGLRAGLALAAGALLGLAPQLALWTYQSGRPLPVQLEPLRFAEPLFVTTLFSTRAGLLPWSPAFYLLPAALWLVRRRPELRRLVWGMGALFALDVYLVACAWTFHGGYGFGARRLSDGAPLLGLAVATCWTAASGRRTRALVAALVALFVVQGVTAMELQRRRRVPSSGAYARTAGTYLRQAGAPEGVARLLERTGYPFVQPAGWLYAARHGVPVATFEGVVGNVFLERDGHWMTLLPDWTVLRFDALHAAHAPAGLALDSPTGPARVTGPVRLLLPLFERQALRLTLIGEPAGGAWAATGARALWQGLAVPAHAGTGGLVIEVPASAVHIGGNTLDLAIPAASRLRELRFAVGGP